MNHAVMELEQLKQRGLTVDAELKKVFETIKAGGHVLHFTMNVQDGNVACRLVAKDTTRQELTLTPVASALVYESIGDMTELLIERAQERGRQIIKVRAEELKAELATEKKRLAAAEKGLKEFLE